MRNKNFNVYLLDKNLWLIAHKSALEITQLSNRSPIIVLSKQIIGDQNIHLSIFACSDRLSWIGHCNLGFLTILHVHY